MKINFNWGTGIIISSAIFMAFTIITGLTLMNQKIDLVTDNYYEKELKFQKQADNAQRTEGKVDVQLEENQIDISFTEKSGKSLDGEVKFYRPSDSAKDFVIPLDADADGKQVINTSKIDRGYWKMQLSWSDGKDEFYYEKPVTIN